MSDTSPVSSVSAAAGGSIPAGLEAAVPVPRAFPPPRCFPDPEPSKAARSPGKVRRNEGSGEQREETASDEPFVSAIPHFGFCMYPVATVGIPLDGVVSSHHDQGAPGPRIAPAPLPGGQMTLCSQRFGFHTRPLTIRGRWGRSLTTVMKTRIPGKKVAFSWPAHSGRQVGGQV